MLFSLQRKKLNSYSRTMKHVESESQDSTSPPTIAIYGANLPTLAQDDGFEHSNSSDSTRPLADIKKLYEFPKNLILKGNLTEGGMSIIDLASFSRVGSIESELVVVKRMRLAKDLPLLPKRNPIISYLMTVFNKRGRRQQELADEMFVANYPYSWEEQQILDRTKLEIKALTCSQHIFVINYYESFLFHREIYIITERCVGDFREIVGMRCDYKNYYSYLNNAVTISQVYHIMAPIADALAYLHGQNFMHKDIKEQNILLTRFGVPKLCDFGLCKDFGEFKNGEVVFNEGDDSGSEFNVAPELVRKRSYNVSVDSWGFGITMLTMSRGGCLLNTPGNGMWEQVKHCLKKGFYDTKEEELYAAMLLFSDKNLLNTGEKERYSEFYGIVMSLVCLRPENRLQISKLRENVFFKQVISNWGHYFRCGDVPGGGLPWENSKADFRSSFKFYRDKIDAHMLSSKYVFE